MILLATLAVACGGGHRSRAQDVTDANDTGRVIPAGTPTERAILAQLGQLPPGSRRALGDGSVVAEPAYHAASGRLCRALQMTEPGQRKVRQRLACSDGRQWFFVPDVLGLEQPAQ
jgi:hypothetical protein